LSAGRVISYGRDGRTNDASTILEKVAAASVRILGPEPDKPTSGRTTPRGTPNHTWSRLPPIRHFTDRKIRVHLFTCVHTLAIAHLMRRQAAQAGIATSVLGVAGGPGRHRRDRPALPGRERLALGPSPDHQITRSPDHQITRSPDHQITRMDPHQQRLFDVFDLRRYAPAGDVGTTPNRRSKTPGPAETMAKPGANFMIAETGTLVVVESEGNGRMCLTMPETLISVVGIEKILPPVTPSAVVGVLAVGSRPHLLAPGVGWLALPRWSRPSDGVGRWVEEGAGGLFDLTGVGYGAGRASERRGWVRSPGG
jgi:hypothetical protein